MSSSALSSTHVATTAQNSALDASLSPAEREALISAISGELWSFVLGGAVRDMAFRQVAGQRHQFRQYFNRRVLKALQAGKSG